MATPVYKNFGSFRKSTIIIYFSPSSFWMKIDFPETKQFYTISNSIHVSIGGTTCTKFWFDPRVQVSSVEYRSMAPLLRSSGRHAPLLFWFVDVRIHVLRDLGKFFDVSRLDVEPERNEAGRTFLRCIYSVVQKKLNFTMHRNLFVWAGCTQFL